MSFDFSFPPHLKELREHARCVAIKGALDFGSFDDSWTVSYTHLTLPTKA